MIVNKEFFFFRTFDLDNRISKMYQDLVYQFNSKINCNDFFELIELDDRVREIIETAKKIRMEENK